MDFGHQYALNGRPLLLQSYIVLYLIQRTHTDYIYHFAESFKRYLTRKNITKTTATAYRNYINLSIKILKYHELKKENYQALASEIKNTQPMIGKHWILDILNR